MLGHERLISMYSGIGNLEAHADISLWHSTISAAVPVTETMKGFEALRGL